MACALGCDGARRNASLASRRAARLAAGAEPERGNLKLNKAMAMPRDNLKGSRIAIAR